MNGKRMHWVNRLAALGLVVGLVAGLASAGSAQSVGGQAYSTYVNTPLGSSGQSPLAVLPAGFGAHRAPGGARGKGADGGGAPAAGVLHTHHAGGKWGGEGGGRAEPGGRR